MPTKGHFTCPQVAKVSLSDKSPSERKCSENTHSMGETVCLHTRLQLTSLEDGWTTRTVSLTGASGSGRSSQESTVSGPTTCLRTGDWQISYAIHSMGFRAAFQMIFWNI